MKYTDRNTVTPGSAAAPQIAPRKILGIQDLGPKLVLGVAVWVLCTLMYTLLQRYPIHPVVMHSDCWLWRVIPFQPAWLWPYLSLFVLVSAAWLLLPTIADARRYTRYFLAMTSVAWLSFLIYPTGCVRPVLSLQSASYHTFIQFDLPTNCFPCLHAAFALLAATSLTMPGRKMSHPRARAAMAVWVVAILLSIGGVRQHTGIDIAGGLVLGGTMATLYAWRKRPAVEVLPVDARLERRETRRLPEIVTDRVFVDFRADDSDAGGLQRAPKRL